MNMIHNSVSKALYIHDMCVSTLAHKLITRSSYKLKSLILVLFVELLQTFVLTREAAFRGYVHKQNYLSFAWGSS